jgi:hypothetical protein
MRVVVTAMGRLVPELVLLVGELSRRFDTVSVLLGTDARAHPMLSMCARIHGVEFGLWSVTDPCVELQRRIEGADAVVHLPPRPDEAPPEGRTVRERSIACVAKAVAGLKRRPCSLLSLVSAEEPGAADEVGTVNEVVGSRDIRFCSARLGVVLRAPGGPFARALCALRTQGAISRAAHAGVVRWIHVLDAARAIAHVLNDESLSGPLDLTAPDPVPADRFATSLWNAFGYPSTLRPAGTSVGRLLSSPQLVGKPVASSRHLVDSGFSYLFPDFNAALADIAQSS